MSTDNTTPERAESDAERLAKIQSDLCRSDGPVYSVLHQHSVWLLGQIKSCDATIRDQQAEIERVREHADLVIGGLREKLDETTAEVARLTRSPSAPANVGAQDDGSSVISRPSADGEQPSPETEHRIEIIFEDRAEAEQAFDKIERALFDLGQIGTAAQPIRQEQAVVTDEHINKGAPAEDAGAGGETPTAAAFRKATEAKVQSAPSADADALARQAAVAYLNSIEGHLNPEEHAAAHFAAHGRAAAERMRGQVKATAEDLLSICDASNWPEEAQSGVGFRLYTEITDRLHEIADDLLALPLDPKEPAP